MRQRTSRLSLGEWYELSELADRASALALILHLNISATIQNVNVRRKVDANVATILEDLTGQIAARIEALEPR